MNTPRTPELAGTSTVRTELHILLAVDCSGSMTGDKMASLNYAVRSAIPAMRAAALDNPDNDVRVRVLRFSDRAEWTARDPIGVEEFTWTNFVAGGETSMGAALAELANALTPAAMPGRQLPPVVVLLSDGMATDDAKAGVAKLMAAPFGATAVRIAIAIGSDADRPLLQRFIGVAGMKPLEANSAETLVNHIRWAASEPIKAISSPARASDPIQDLAPSAASENEQGGELVW